MAAHRVAPETRLTTNAELAERHGLSNGGAVNYLVQQHVPAEDRRYRWTAIKVQTKTKIPKKRMDQLVASVRAELAAHDLDPKSRLSTKEELAASLGNKVSADYLSLFLSEALSRPEYERRWNALNRQGRRENGGPAVTPDDVAERARERIASEIAAHRLDPDFAFSLDAELQSSLGIGRGGLTRQMQTFSREDRQYRARWIIIQQRSRLSVAALNTLAEDLREETEKHRRGDVQELRTYEEVGAQHDCPAAVAERMMKRLPEELREYRRTRQFLQTARRTRQRKGIVVQGFAYDSYSEAVAGESLRKYVPAFVPIDGETAQIPVDRSRLDFLLVNHRVFIEFHPANLTDARAEMPEEWIALPVAELRARIDAAYLSDRRALVARSPIYSEHQVVLVTGADDLYDNVLVPYGLGLPSREDFRREYVQLWRALRASGPRTARETRESPRVEAFRNEQSGGLALLSERSGTLSHNFGARDFLLRVGAAFPDPFATEATQALGKFRWGKTDGYIAKKALGTAVRLIDALRTLALIHNRAFPERVPLDVESIHFRSELAKLLDEVLGKETDT